VSEPFARGATSGHDLQGSAPGSVFTRPSRNGHRRETAEDDAPSHSL
jgi:hypothetical protein